MMRKEIKKENEEHYLVTSKEGAGSNIYQTKIDFSHITTKLILTIAKAQILMGDAETPEEIRTIKKGLIIQLITHLPDDAGLHIYLGLFDSLEEYNKKMKLML